MASLTDQTIGSTYTLLLKLDSSAVDTNLQKIESGIGTDTALSISTNAIAIDATDKLGFDGTNSGTYITESADGILDIYVDAVRTLILKEDGGNSKVGIGKVPVDGVLEVKGQTASSPVISVDGSANNGFIMMSDNYTAGESQYSTGVTQSGAATYIANRVHTATDAVYTDAAGWKSSTDASSYRGCAIVLDGNTGTTGGSISLYYGHSDGTVATGSTKALTRGFILDYTGKVGIGTSSPDATLHVAGSFAAAGPSETFQTFSGTDTTPSVANGNLFKTHASGQTLTTFDNGVNGQIITVISTAAVVFAVSGNLQAGTTNITTASGDVTQWVYDGTNWYLLSWMDDSINLSSGGF